MIRGPRKGGLSFLFDREHTVAEQVRIESVTRGEGKVIIALELDINEFWEDQLARNKELRVAKRPLLAALEHDAVHGPYVSLLPVFAKIDVSALDRQFREHNPTPKFNIEVPGLVEFCKSHNIEIKGVKDDESTESAG